MINFPSDIIKQLPLGIQKGIVIYTKTKFDNGKELFHFFIALTEEVDQGIYCFVMATTDKTGFYDRNKIYESEIIRISAGTLPFFSENTIVNCREIRKISTLDLKNNFINKSLTYVGEIPAEYINKIRKIIEKSRFIPDKEKKLILD